MERVMPRRTLFKIVS